jgi:hypothetical protein
MLWNVLRTLLCGVEDDDDNIMELSLYSPEPTRRVTASPLDFACQSLALSGIREGRKSEMVWNDWEFGMWDYPGWKKQERVYGEDSDPRYEGRQTDDCTLLKGSSLRIMDSRSMTGASRLSAIALGNVWPFVWGPEPGTRVIGLSTGDLVIEPQYTQFNVICKAQLDEPIEEFGRHHTFHLLVLEMPVSNRPFYINETVRYEDDQLSAAGHIMWALRTWDEKHTTLVIHGYVFDKVTGCARKNPVDRYDPSSPHRWYLTVETARWGTYCARPIQDHVHWTLQPQLDLRSSPMYWVFFAKYAYRLSRREEQDAGSEYGGQEDAGESLNRACCQNYH